MNSKRMLVRTENLLRCLVWLIPMAASAIWTVAAQAHHSLQWLLDENGERVIAVLEGEVRAYRIANPHGVLIVAAPNAEGEAQNWLIDLNPATQLTREGWTDDLIEPGDKVTVAVNRILQPKRGALRALLIHGKSDGAPDELYVAYGIRGDSPIMRRLQERLPTCGTIDRSYMRTECFVLDDNATAALEEEFPGSMGYIFP